MPRQSKSTSKAEGVRASTPSTPSTQPLPEESVEGVEGRRKLPQYHWQMEAGLGKNFRQLGRLLASLTLQLYQAADGGGLIQVDGGKIRRIATAKELAPLLIDHVSISVTRQGK